MVRFSEIWVKERMSYVREESMIIYKSKDGKNTKDFGALDFLFLRLEISDYGVYLCFILERSKRHSIKRKVKNIKFSKN